MNEYPPTAVDGELVDSIFVYQDASATGGKFCYLPRDLGWVADSSGEPDIWVDIGQKNNALYLKAQLALSEKILSEVRDDLKLRHHLEDVSLRPGALEISSATIAFTDGLPPLSISSIQPTAPFLANFSGAVSAAQRDAVIAAMTGNRGRVTVSYKATLQLAGSATARITGDLAKDINALIEWVKGGFLRRREITEEICAEQLKKAFSQKHLSSKIESAPNTPEALGEDALDDLEDEVVQKLLEALANGAKTVPFNSYPIDISKTRTDIHQVALSYTVDLADWFADFDGASHVRKTDKPFDPNSGGSGGSSGGGKDQGTANLSLAMEPGEVIDRRGQAILSAIKVTIGGQTYALEGPQFRPVEIDAKLAGSSMVVSTSYARGSGFEYEGTYSGGALKLDQSMLGLQRVDIDASALIEARATTVTIQVNYLPESQGTRDQNTVRFDSADKDWTTTWWLVTRSEDLGGSLKWSWTANTRVGGTLRQSTTNTTDTTLTLDPRREG